MILKENFIVVQGNKIRLLEGGDSSNDTIVFLHGLGASADRWEFVMPYMIKKFHVIAPDIIGFGYSDKPAVNYTVDFFVDFIFDFLKTLQSKVSIVASSLGGHITAECAIKQNPQIQRMVLVSPSGINPRITPAMNTYTMAMLYPDLDRAKDAFYAMSGKNKENDIVPKVIEDFVNRMKMPNAKMVFLSTLLGLKNAKSVQDRLNKITIPTMVIWGDRDTVIPPRYAKIFVSNIQKCQFVHMKGCGHTPFTEEPEIFSKIVSKFISE